MEESRERKRLRKARETAEREREGEGREVEEPQEADAVFEDLLVDANNGIEEKIDNKPTQVAPIIKLRYKMSQLAHHVRSLQDKYFGKSCPYQTSKIGNRITCTIVPVKHFHNSNVILHYGSLPWNWLMKRKMMTKISLKIHYKNLRNNLILSIKHFSM